MHERLACSVSQWQPPTSHTPSPYHLWLRFDGGSCLERPLFLAAAYLPPYRSMYGLKSSIWHLRNTVATVADEAVAASALPGSADVLVAGDLNGTHGQPA